MRSKDCLPRTEPRTTTSRGQLIRGRNFLIDSSPFCRSLPVSPTGLGRDLRECKSVDKSVSFQGGSNPETDDRAFRTGKTSGSLDPHDRENLDPDPLRHVKGPTPCLKTQKY